MKIIVFDLGGIMPDELFRQDIQELLKYFDLYLSSLKCGFRRIGETAGASGEWRVKNCFTTEQMDKDTFAISEPWKRNLSLRGLVSAAVAIFLRR